MHIKHWVLFFCFIFTATNFAQVKDTKRLALKDLIGGKSYVIDTIINNVTYYKEHSISNSLEKKGSENIAKEVLKTKNVEIEAIAKDIKNSTLADLPEAKQLDKKWLDELYNNTLFDTIYKSVAELNYKSVNYPELSTDTLKATLIQTRHRIPEEPLSEGQILVFQVPMPDILETVEPDTYKARVMHANADYSKLWVLLYEDTSLFGDSRISNRYPVIVENRYAMDPSPIPKYDTTKLGNSKALQLFGKTDLLCFLR